MFQETCAIDIILLKRSVGKEMVFICIKTKPFLSTVLMLLFFFSFKNDFLRVTDQVSIIDKNLLR